MKKIIITLTIFALTASFAQEMKPPRGGNSGQPPKEAISACKNKDEGSSCSFKSPRGDSPEGTCQTDGEYLACMPENNPQRQ